MPTLKSDSTHVSFRVDAETRAAVEAQAEREKRQLSNMLRVLIDAGLKARSAEQRAA